MMNRLTKQIVFSLIFSLLASLSVLNANTIDNDLYIFPKQADDAKDRISKLIKKSKDSILIGMYNFSYKKFAKQLIKASKRGVEITVIFDKSKVKKDDKIYNLLKQNNINVVIPKIKLHTKVAIFDDKELVLGSSNWTKQSFNENYEIILFTNDKKIINKSKKFLKSL